MYIVVDGLYSTPEWFVEMRSRDEELVGTLRNERNRTRLEDPKTKNNKNKQVQHGSPIAKGDFGIQPEGGTRVFTYSRLLGFSTGNYYTIPYAATYSVVLLLE